MHQLIARGIDMALTRGVKKNQHCVNMDGFKVYYETIGSKRG